MKTIAILMLPLAAACGRMGFDQANLADPDVPLDHLSCGAPTRFAVGTRTSELAATATPRGYNVFTVDDGGGVHGFTYEFETGTLGPQLGDVPLSSNANGPLGSLALGGPLLLAVPYGRPDAKGTALIPVDADLAARGQPAMHAGWFGDVSALAPAGNSAVAFLGQLDSGEVDVKFVSPLGTDQGAAHTVINAGEGVSMATIIPAGTGFLVVWGANTPSPNEVRAEILDSQFAVTTPPKTISSDRQFDSYVPRAGYSAASGTYLFAWMEKTDGDQIWISLRDSNLREMQHVKIGVGSRPAIAAGDKDFLVVWENGMRLEAARIALDGTVTPLSILGSGGKLAAWDVVVGNGQPALVWVETGGTGPNLRLDPLCN